MLTIQFGQCGNQLGHELFTKISKDIESRNSGLSYDANYEYSEASCDRWFSGITKDGRRIARGILVDTEKKVVEKIRTSERRNSQWRYSRKNEICQTNGGGAGNNWAYGYRVKARELENELIEAVRAECERADRLDGFLGLLGCAGGTGSGVGSRMVEIFREEYPTKTILAGLILPFASGEVATQNYNGLLTLAKFTDLADAIILLENDQLLRICTPSLGGHQRNNAEGRFLQDMNEVACEKLLAVFQPTRGIRNEANFFANKMAAHPGYKMATIKCTLPVKFCAKSVGSSAGNANNYETGSFRWKIHMRQLRHTLWITGASSNCEVTSHAGNSRGAFMARGETSESNHHAYRRSIANLLITRGYTSNSTNNRNTLGQNENDPICWEQLNEDTLYPFWVPQDQRFTHLHEKRRFLEHEKFVTLVTNNSQICEPLDGLVSRAWNSYTHAAFLHRYKQFGLEDDDFLHAFAKVENVLKLYGELDEKL